MFRCPGSIPGSLTATVHGDDGDEVDRRLCASLLAVMAGRAGRLVWNGWPTGVAVSWAMQHGGPYPATTSDQVTSVGAAAIRRFLRPVTYQGVPASLIPPGLGDGGLRGAIRRNGRIEVGV